MKKILSLLSSSVAVVAAAVLPALALAHGEDHPEEAVEVIEEGFVVMSVHYQWIAGIGTIILIVLALAAFFVKKHTDSSKKAFFIGLTTTVVVTTVALVGFTVYQTVVSESKGPIHWHADFKIYNCGEEVDLIDPTGLLNRVGTPEFHEHGDNRVHIEGTIHNFNEIDFGSFFEVVDGELTDGTFVVPTNDGDVVMNDGGSCNSASNSEAELQVFLYKTDVDANTLTMTKLEHPETYIPSPWSQVPPGDCLVFEYSDQELSEPQGDICPFQQIELNDGELELINAVETN